MIGNAILGALEQFSPERYRERREAMIDGLLELAERDNDGGHLSPAIAAHVVDLTLHGDDTGLPYEKAHGIVNRARAGKDGDGQPIESRRRYLIVSFRNAIKEHGLPWPFKDKG